MSLEQPIHDQASGRGVEPRIRIMRQLPMRVGILRDYDVLDLAEMEKSKMKDDRFISTPCIWC